MILIKILLVLLILAVIILAAYIQITSNIAFDKAFKAKRKTREYEVERLKSWNLWDEEYINSLPIEDVEITSKDGLKLKGHLIEKHKENNKYVLLVHGYSAHYSLHMPFVKLFEDEGFNILLVEERAHGDSEGTFATYGFKESEDLDLWIDFIEKRRGEELYIGIHGQSMGAAAALICGARNKKVKFVVEDCGYSSAKEQLRNEFAQNKFASFKLVYWYLNLRVKHKCGFKFEDADPMKEILKSRVPVFFVHGDKDKKVSYEMCLNMHEKRKGPKDKILIVKKADHLQAYLKDSEEYKKTLHDFLKNI